MIVPLQIPPGAYRNGTEYQAKGRWRDVGLVRWHEGAMLPVGGFLGIGHDDSTSVSSSARGALAWTDNSGNGWIVIGTPTAAYALDDEFALTDITPAGWTTGTEDAGDPPWLPSNLATTWTWDTFGQIPIGCQDLDGRLWEWDLNVANNLVAVTNAPTSNLAVVVTQERFVMALGAGGDPRLVQWSDREDRTVWTPASTNQAGSFPLDTEGDIRCGLQLRGETLILTTTDVFRATYIGAPNVYAFDRIGGDYGVVGRRAAIAVGERAFWLGDGTFFMYQGGYVSELKCDVWDYFFSDLDVEQKSKTYAWHNSEFNEVWWHYQSTASADDIDSYVAFNYALNVWHYGPMTARAVIPAGGGNIIEKPIGFFPQEQYTDGFGSDLGWTLGTNWQIAGGVLLQSSPTASDASFDLTGYTAGERYVVTIAGVINYSAGTLTVDLGGADSFTVTANGSTSGLLTAGTADPTITLSADGTFNGDLGALGISTCFLKQMETGNVYETAEGSEEIPYAETGPLEIGDGERRVHVTRVYPDEQDAGELSLIFKHREYPTASETTVATVTAANPTDVRFSGRQFKLRVQASTRNTDWRSGVHRLEIKNGGKR